MEANPVDLKSIPLMLRGIVCFRSENFGKRHLVGLKSMRVIYKLPLASVDSNAGFFWPTRNKIYMKKNLENQGRIEKQLPKIYLNDSLSEKNSYHSQPKNPNNHCYFYRHAWPMRELHESRTFPECRS